MSEQPRPKMRYPKGRIVLVRDSTVAICLNNNPGAVLLSTLLFWYDNPHKFDTYQGDDFTLCRTQASIEEQACHQIDVKTIHDTAVPLLQLLGYLTVVEKMNGNLYTLHMDRVLAGYAAYENGPGCLKAYLKASMQLESALIVMAPSELESALINKSWLYFELERVLIATRVGSNCKRGRKPKQKAASKAKMADTETYRDSIETYDKERAVTDARALEYKNDNHSYSHDETMGHKAWNCEAWCRAHEKTCTDYQAWIESGGRKTPTEPRVEAVKIGVSNGTRDTDPANRHPVTDRLVNLADQDTTVAQGATDGRLPHPTMHRDPHSPHDPHRGHTDTEVHSSAPLVSASTPGRAASPPAAAVPHSLQGPQDGATTALEAGEPRASGKRNVHLSAHEAEMRAWLEELRATELDLDARDVTAIRCLATKKGTDDKEMFLNIVAVLDSDPWFEEHHVSVDFYWINRQWNNKYMFLQRKKPAHPPNGQKTIGGYAWFGEV